MLLRVAPSISLLDTNPGENLTPLLSSCASSSPGKLGNGSIVCAAAKQRNSRTLTGVVFDPSEEVKKQLMLIPTVSPQDSLARQNYSDECESVVNDQINAEYNVSYAYHAMFAFFDRDNVALKGLTKFFKESSAEERKHAEKFMNYQNKRGGKVKLQRIQMPVTEFDNFVKGDALYAMELALNLMKLQNQKLLDLHEVANRNNDVQLADFVESEFLTQQVVKIKKMSEYIAMLRRVGRGFGVWHFDQMLLHEGAAAN